MRNAYLFVVLNIFSVLVSAQTEERNFFLNTWAPRSFTVPDSYNSPPERTATGSVVTVTIDVSDTVNKVLPTQFGANITFRSGDGILTAGNRISTFDKSGLNVYRYPAGSGSNIYFFDGNYPGSFTNCLDKNGNTISWNPIDGTKSNALKPENFVKFIQDVKGEAIVVVNYFYARYGQTQEGTREARVLQAAKYAADFVRKMNIDLNAGIKYWEVGNECYGAWETGYNVEGLGTVTGTEYGEDFKVFVSEMKKVDPTIKVGAVLFTKDTDWNPQVVSQVQNDADYFIIHQYFTSSRNATPENILGSVGMIKENMDLLRTTVEQNTNFTLDHFPVALTEFNSRGNYTTNMVNSIFFTRILGEVMKNGLGLSTTWTGEWKYKNDPDNQVKSLLAINDPDQGNYTPYSTYMAYHFYDKMFGDHMVSASVTNSNDVNCYASRFGSGEVGISVVNPTASNIAIKLRVNNLRKYRLEKLFRYEVRGSFQYRNTKFYINEETGTTTGGGPDDFDTIILYGESFSNGDTIVIPPYSTNFIVLNGEKTTGIFNLKRPDVNIRLFPNPATSVLHVKSEARVKEYKIYNVTGTVATEGKFSESIDVSGLIPGFYFVKFTTDKGEAIFNFLKK